MVSRREGFMSTDFATLYPSVNELVAEKVASRVHVKDATLYSFADEARECAENFMGWADLASNPPVKVKKIKKLADRFADEGMKTVLLVGQGGSTQASMTMTKFIKDANPRMKFRTMDSDSPVRLRKVLAGINPKSTVVIVSSKSGGTLEMRCMLAALREVFLKEMSEKKFRSRLVAITDPGSPLEQRAKSEGWAAILSGEPTVGGRFSALSVFGLLPAALVGIDIKAFVARAKEAEQRCSEDSPDNPALQLAAFMFDSYKAGRAKLAFVTQKRGRVLGLWTEQLVAESTGKQGQGILPYLEVDPLLLAKDEGDRAVVTYCTEPEGSDELIGFEKALSVMNPAIPRIDYRLDTVEDLAEHFVMWEYATAMCGYLMQVSPFDQPDVASAKAKVLEILDAGLPAPKFEAPLSAELDMGWVKVRTSECCSQARDVRGALKCLFASMRPGDYFAINAFLPFTGEGRGSALEAIRRTVAVRSGLASCLEVGPRFLHSTGQLQKGGPDTGVFLVLSAEESVDVVLDKQPAVSLGKLAEAQATGDALTLADRGRRCLHLHLPDNSAVTLRVLADMVDEVLLEIEAERAQA